MCAILESHVDISKLQNVCSKVFTNWVWTSNNQYCQRGTRIILGWDPDYVDVMLLNQSDQVLHCQVRIIAVNKVLFCSFVYAGNKIQHRRELWRSLKMHKRFVDVNPWAVLGDFNVSLNIEDSTRGSSGLCNGMVEFKECVEEIGIEDIHQSGIRYTWNQRPNSNSGILKKLDRVMVNGAFLNLFVEAFAVFQLYRISDHSPLF